MTRLQKNSLILTISLFSFTACKENVVDVKPIVVTPSATTTNPFDPTLITTVLKDLTDVPIGIAVNLDEFMQNGAVYSSFGEI